jgi:uncharacterized protein YndB with AHSA1/START domain
MNDPFVAISRTVRASPKALFEAWLNPEALKEFMLPHKGTAIENVVIDARTGGVFSFVMVIGETQIPIKGRYLAMSKYDFLEFTWRSPQTTKGSIVTLEFKKISATETEIVLSHRGLDSDELRRGHISGWTSVLECLSRKFLEPRRRTV